MEAKEEIITPHEELVKLVRDGYFFNFCVAFALNKGYRNALKAHEEVKFMVGDYEAKFDAKHGCFALTHDKYFLRIIHAYMNGEVVFVGDKEEEVISELLTELEKEKP